jgi:hypothetical protein
MALQNLSFGQAFQPGQTFDPALMGTFTPGMMQMPDQPISAGAQTGGQIDPPPQQGASATPMGSSNMGASTANGIQQGQPQPGGPGANSPQGGNILNQGLMGRMQQPTGQYPGGNAQANPTANAAGGGAAGGAVANGHTPSISQQQLQGIQSGMGLMAASHQRGANMTQGAIGSASALGKLLSQYGIQGLMGASGDTDGAGALANAGQGLGAMQVNLPFAGGAGS